MEAIKRQTLAVYGWLVIGQSVGAGLAYGLLVLYVCMSANSAATAILVLYAFAFLNQYVIKEKMRCHSRANANI